MARPFDAFVMFAEMRTGSNHLEESLNALADVTCHGEVFNPVFIGTKDRYELAGFDMDKRERDPEGLLNALIDATGGLAGFRFFHDHDPRILDTILRNPRIAKIILTRNPLDSYVSRRIAAQTGQWRLTDATHARTRRISFDLGEFAGMLDDWTRFRARLRRGLQLAGQTAFEIRYEDINDVDVLNGLARFLGSEHCLRSASDRLKRQNPGLLREKVENYDEMRAELATLDWFGLDRIVDADVPPVPGVPGFVAHPSAGLLFVPVAGAPGASIRDWMAALDDAGAEGLIRGMSQRNLRRWMRSNPGFSSFTVLRHPVLRAFAAYERLGEPEMENARQLLESRFGVTPPCRGAPRQDGFLSFLSFLNRNLVGRTSVRTMTDWKPQTAILQAAARVVPLRHVLRENEAEAFLNSLLGSNGRPPGPALGAETAAGRLVDIHDDAVEKAVHDIYRRDYLHFGFGPWSPA